jgi:Carboxypeptidase regulatory-like domain
MKHQRPSRPPRGWGRFVLILAAAHPWAAIAQTPTMATPDSILASIAGAVRDSLGLPVAGASVLISPIGAILVTDSAGRFNARRLEPGLLTINVRRLGFAPAQLTLTLKVGEARSLDVVMQRLPQVLAGVEIRADRQCPRFTVEGLLCRRETGRGFLMDRQQILAKGAAFPDYPDLVLRDVPGFRRSLHGSAHTVESTVGWRCIKYIFDGGFPYSYAPIRKVTELYAVEVYQPPDIPPEYGHWYWVDNKKAKLATPCTLVVMWSMSEAQRELKQMQRTKK